MRTPWRGYYDLGRIRIPPLPQKVILTDRADGTEWLVTYNTTDGSSDGYGYISITDSFNTTGLYRIFNAYEEPIIDTQPTVRLIVNNGYLGMDIDEGLDQGVSDMDQAPIYARYNFSNSIRRIFAASDWAPKSQHLAWEAEDL